MSTTTEQPMERSTAGLTNVLLDEIDSLRSGRTNENRAHSIARLANGVIATKRLELDVCLIARQHGIPSSFSLDGSKPAGSVASISNRSE